MIPKTFFLARGVLTEEFSIKVQFFPLDRESCAFSSSNFFGQHTLRKLPSLINVYMVFHRRSVFFYRQQGDNLNSLICVVHFLNNFNSVFDKKGS